MRAVLARLADDEARHAELGWSVIAWCTAEGGETVRAAVARAAGALPTACGRACVVPGDRDASGAAALFASTLASVAERARHGARGDLRSPGPQDGVPRVRGVSAQVAAAPPREAAEAVAAVA